MAFVFHEHLAGAVKRALTRPVWLPWPYPAREGDDTNLAPGTLCAIELDVPSIEAPEWAAALDGISIAPVEKRIGRQQMGQLLAAAMHSSPEERDKIVESKVRASGVREEALVRAEGLSSPTEPTIFRADADRLCVNGSTPPPILNVIRSGRLVPVKRQLNALTSMLETAGADIDLVPPRPDELVPIEQMAPVPLDAAALASLFNVESGVSLNGNDLSVPAQPMHVAVLRFLIVAASDHTAYDQRLADAKKNAAGGANGEKPPSARKRQRKRKASPARR